MTGSKYHTIISIMAPPATLVTSVPRMAYPMRVPQAHVAPLWCAYESHRNHLAQLRMWIAGGTVAQGRELPVWLRDMALWRESGLDLIFLVAMHWNWELLFCRWDPICELWGVCCDLKVWPSRYCSMGHWTERYPRWMVYNYWLYIMLSLWQSQILSVAIRARFTNMDK